jgi:hypothetical protein
MSLPPNNGPRHLAVALLIPRRSHAATGSVSIVTNPPPCIHCRRRPRKVYKTSSFGVFGALSFPSIQQHSWSVCLLLRLLDLNTVSSLRRHLSALINCKHKVFHLQIGVQASDICFEITITRRRQHQSQFFLGNLQGCLNHSPLCPLPISRGEF